MRRIVLLCILVSMSFSAYSQESLYIQGYYMQKFLKDEILFKEQNQVLRDSGKSFGAMIDYKKQLFFFPLQINANIPLWKSESIGNVLLSNPDYQNTEIFCFPPFNLPFKNYFDTIDISIHNIELPVQCHYYVNENDTVHVYKIFYIEGHALRIKVENDYLNPQRDIDIAVKWNLDPSRIHKSTPSFYVYLFYKADIVRCDFPPEDFMEWYPP